MYIDGRSSGTPQPYRVSGTGVRYFGVDQWDLPLISSPGFTFQGVTINNCQVCDSGPDKKGS